MAAEPARTAEDSGEGALSSNSVRASYDFSTFEGLKQFNDNVEKVEFNYVSVDKYQGDYVNGQLQLTTILESLVEGNEVMYVKFGGDSKFLSVGYRDGNISVFNPEGMCIIEKLKTYQTKHCPVTSFKFLPDTHEGSSFLLATYTSGHLAFWNLSEKLLSSIIPEKRESQETLNAASNQSATRVATVGADPIIIVYDIETKSEINKLRASEAQVVDGHNNRVFAIRFEPGSENVFVTGGWDKTIQFWDCRQERSFRHIYGPHICGDGIDIEPGTKNILTASWRLDDNLEVWDFGSGSKLACISDNDFKSHLYSAQWFGKDKIACVGSNNNIGRVIERATSNTIGWMSDLPNGLFCLDCDWHLAKPKLAFGSGSRVFIARCVEKKF